MLDDRRRAGGPSSAYAPVPASIRASSSRAGMPEYAKWLAAYNLSAEAVGKAEVYPPGLPLDNS
ncbi:hypothetical protein AB0N19_07665 [Streptomyces sp. NPDC051132]|uniref:hypothetical protein n=1 Tax=Streptomyces sp. NPDC051132 TaxID=3155667 RepID=UPI00341D4658